ncbi:methyltransferase family protein [Rhodococcus marinonascens]|uniref:methyltransferase family protein n=1 Tax=Rhodococcus marinonascens TaxID=38311 RepID=UPI000A05D071|nr:isoprenylcysteine carboxylmethyltransferase family protein [Rhodococcus marinonascens]
MVIAALTLYFVFAVLGFGWRSWRQWRRTGSTGFRGISGRLGSLEWMAGAGFIIAIVAGIAAALLQLTRMVSPLGSLHTWWIQALGVALALFGIAATVYSQNGMGESWRIGVDASETTTLVRHGAFSMVRNPIFTAMLVFAGGIALMTPNILAIAGFVLMLTTIELQVRVVEEPYLLLVHGDDYRDYSGTVGRFIPGVGYPTARNTDQATVERRNHAATAD